MPSEMSKFKKYPHLNNKYQKINLSIKKMHCLNNMLDVKEDINKKYNTINELKTLRNEVIKDKKEIIIFLTILFILINSLSLNSGQ